MAQQKQPMIYNAPRFKVKQYDFGVFVGPAAGEKAKPFTVNDLETGKKVKLSDFKGKWLVIETGSSTCSMYTKNIDEMRKVREENPDVEFVIIYVREAHPGERLHQHRSYDEKIAAAKLLKPRYGEGRRVLVDELEGDFHKKYGMMPNVMYVIRPDGIVHYRVNWATPDSLRKALADRENFHTVENANVKELKASRGMFSALRTMWTGGVLALWDFVVATPQLVERHKKVDEYYQKHGRFENEPPKPKPAKQKAA
jgi:hypothetical protein